MKILTPEEMRAQVAKVRSMSTDLTSYDLFSLESGIACGMLLVAAEQIEKLQALVTQQRRLIDIHETFATTTPNADAVKP
jgi:hypothetical protein